MKQMTEISQEVIWENNTTKWTEKFETVTPETIDVPNYEYWNWQNTLDAPLALRNLSAWWKYYTSYIWINWTWTLSITWVWFKPKLIMFYAVGGNSMSQLSAITKYDKFWTRVYNYLNIARWTTTSRAVELFQETEQYTLADLTSIDDDWFTINKTRVDFSATLNYTCFW